MTTTENDPVLLRLLAGRARAVANLPYLGTALFAMVPRRSVGRGLKTGATDKFWRFYYNPDFVMSLTVDQVAGLWIHELGHLLREHILRFEALGEPRERHPLFNKAGDAAINADSLDCGVELIPGYDWLPEKIPGATRGMAAEQMYRLLLDTPEADKVVSQKVDLLLLPSSALRYDYGSGQRLGGITRRRILTDPTTVTILDALGQPVPNAVGTVRVHDRRTLDFTLDLVLDPGAYTVVVTSGTETATATLRIVSPTIRMRPDHVTRGYAAPLHMVVEGVNTRFTDAPTTVEVLDSDGNPVPGAVSNTVTVSDDYVTFNLGTVPDGVYQVVVSTGPEVCTAVLPVGMPYLGLSPQGVESGHGTPYPIAATAEDFTFDATTTIEFCTIDPLAGVQPVPGAVGAVTVTSNRTANFTIAKTLDDGSYLAVATTGSEQAVATFSVGGEGDGEGDGSGSGQAGDGDGDDDGDGFPDCGSAAGGGRRPWEDEDSDGSDGAVDGGRADSIRRETAKEIERASRSVGNVPGGWVRWAKEILDPAVDWREELNSVVRRVLAEIVGQEDYTYTRPAREADAVPDFVLPGTAAPRPPKVRVIVDTSGSMRDGDLGRCLSEIQGLLVEVTNNGGDPIEVIACDASPADMQEVTSVEGIALTGGGGTDMTAGIMAAAQTLPLADLIITLTDGETGWPSEVPEANPYARYIAVLVRGEATYSEVPDWMHKIVIQDGELAHA